MVDNIPDFIVRYDRDLRRTYAKLAWERASSPSAREVVNDRPSGIPRSPSASHEKYIQKLRAVLANGAPQTIQLTWVNARGEESVKLDRLHHVASGRSQSET